MIKLKGGKGSVLNNQIERVWGRGGAQKFN